MLSLTTLLSDFAGGVDISTVNVNAVDPFLALTVARRLSAVMHKPYSLFHLDNKYCSLRLNNKYLPEGTVLVVQMKQAIRLMHDSREMPCNRQVHCLSNHQ